MTYKGYLSAKEDTKNKIIKMLDQLEVDLVNTTSFEYDNGWNECNMKWDLRIIDIIEKIKAI